ncbi:M55 family metallopeptidase [Arthrobacter sp. CJ23]|uniref:M55 family metallopeptidase n=1 Tax=Arthrobacter sp. CJ23 TaxID=2972479 RepID=UPI00215CC363|nr:M55 family metallopeptidase [Arthrobacter sp. CJ23]UVJ37762.1 M55 family metallopeptidase [Arthrobacter sp. CJ23]
MNGAVVSEAEVNAMYAASLGVPVGLVSGDDVICRIAREQFAGVEAVEVKVAHGYTSTASLAPSVARGAIRDAAARAVRNAATLTVPELPTQFRVAVDMPTATAAELALSIPGARRTSERSVECTVTDAGQVLGLIVVFYELAASAMHAKTALFMRR